MGTERQEQRLQHTMDYHHLCQSLQQHFETVWLMFDWEITYYERKQRLTTKQKIWDDIQMPTWKQVLPNEQ